MEGEEVPKLAKDITEMWRGKVEYDRDGIKLDEPIITETRKIEFDQKKIEDRIKESGNTYLSHFTMDGKTVIFVLHDDDGKPGTFVFQDDGTTRKPTKEEWEKNKKDYFTPQVPYKKGYDGEDVK